jgi:hypothetical protein
LVLGDLGHFETNDVVKYDSALLLGAKHREQTLHLTAREVGVGGQALFRVAEAIDQGLFASPASTNATRVTELYPKGDGVHPDAQ